MFGGNTKMCVASRKRSCLHKNDQIEGVRRGGVFKQCQDFYSVPFQKPLWSEKRVKGFENLSRTAWWLSWQRATVSRIRSGSTPVAPSAWSSKCWNDSSFWGKAFIPWKDECEHIFFQLKDIKNIQGPTWKYIVSVSRARWRRHPAPVEVRLFSSTWFHKFFRSWFFSLRDLQGSR